MRITTPILTGLGLLCLLSACHHHAVTPSVADKLTGKRWTLYKVELGLAGHAERSDWKELQICNQDDAVIYLKNGTVTVDIGLDDCGGTEKPAIGTWALRGNNKILYTTDGKSVEKEISFPDINTLAVSEGDTTCCFDTDGDGQEDTKGWYVMIFKGK